MLAERQVQAECGGINRGDGMHDDGLQVAPYPPDTGDPPPSFGIKLSSSSPSSSLMAATADLDLSIRFASNVRISDHTIS